MWRMDIPRLIKTDQGSEFNNKLNSELYAEVENKTCFNDSLYIYISRLTVVSRAASKAETRAADNK